MSSLWNTLTGQKSSQREHGATQSSSSSSSSQLSSQPSRASEPTTSFDPSAGQGVEAFLGGSTFSDPSQLHPLAGLNSETLEYLSLEDAAVVDAGALPSRGFTDDLCYGTGTTYLIGLGIGGAWGLQEGLRRSMNQPPKLRLNSVLNAVTRRGPFLGNSAGVVAITYNCFNGLIGQVRGKHDSANTILAGALSGMLFKCTRGLRQMAISGGIVASVAGAWAITRKTFFPIAEPKHEHSL